MWNIVVFKIYLITVKGEEFGIDVLICCLKLSTVEYNVTLTN